MLLNSFFQPPAEPSIVMKGNGSLLFSKIRGVIKECLSSSAVSSSAPEMQYMHFSSE